MNRFNTNRNITKPIFLVALLLISIISPAISKEPDFAQKKQYLVSAAAQLLNAADYTKALKLAGVFIDLDPSDPTGYEIIA
jgi:hypothetical protein